MTGRVPLNEAIPGGLDSGRPGRWTRKCGSQPGGPAEGGISKCRAL